jgi:ABC-type amino acid transport substrate-binding protein
LGVRLRFAAAVVACCIAASAHAAEKTSPLESRKVLRVLRMDAPPDDQFFNLGEGNPGFDREILEGFAKLHHVKLEPVTVPSWEDLVPALLDKKGDIAAGRFTVTPARQDKVDFTVEVFPTRHVVLTRRPTRTILTRDELRAVKVGTVKGSAVEEAVLAAGVPAANLIHIDPTSTGRVLRDGKVKVLVSNVESAVVDMKKDPELQIGMFLGPPRSLAYAVRKDDPELLKALNEYLEHTRRSPTWNRLVVKYFGEAGLEILKTVRGN